MAYKYSNRHRSRSRSRSTTNDGRVDLTTARQIGNPINIFSYYTLNTKSRFPCFPTFRVSGNRFGSNGSVELGDTSGRLKCHLGLGIKRSIVFRCIDILHVWYFRCILNTLFNHSLIFLVHIYLHGVWKTVTVIIYREIRDDAIRILVAPITTWKYSVLHLFTPFKIVKAASVQFK